MRAVVAAVLLCLSGVVLAQDNDPFFAGRAQMVLDPSRTGFDPGVRTTLLHNDQWLQLPGMWSSDMLLAEWCGRSKRKASSAWVGVGLAAARERQGVAGSRVATLGVIPAMHLRSGRRSYLAAGMEVRWVNGAYGNEAGQWGSQYDGLRYDASLPSGEAATIGTASWLEARAGVSFAMKRAAESPRRRERDVLVAGLSTDHLGRLRLHDGAALPNGPPIRYTGYLFSELPYAPWDEGFFSAELIVHVQGPFHTGRINVYAGKHLLNRTREENGPMLVGFKAGLGYRLQDALLVNASLDLGKATVGMAYGWSVFEKNGLANGRRTFELMVQVGLV